jgi:exodeoxyribonuclease-5
MTLANPKGSSVIDRQTGTFYCPILGISPEGHEEALRTEREEQARERVRLWYVASTRARELLVLPHIAAEQSDAAWIRLVDLKLQDLPALDVSGFSTEIPKDAPEQENPQSLDTFKAEAQSIVAHVKTLRWESPSRHDERETVAAEDSVRIWTEFSNMPMSDVGDGLLIQGGRNRGLVLHKLMEEILTGETQGDAAAVTARANVLISELGCSSAPDPRVGVSAEEVSACVMRTWALPEIAVLRRDLLAEVPVYASRTNCGEEIATAGIADALTLSADGRPDIVVDWKSDVNPAPPTLDHYHQQVRSYLRMTGARRGLIVLMTTGSIITVDPSGTAT